MRPAAVSSTPSTRLRPAVTCTEPVPSRVRAFVFSVRNTAPVRLKSPPSTSHFTPASTERFFSTSSAAVVALCVTVSADGLNEVPYDAYQVWASFGWNSTPARGLHTVSDFGRLAAVVSAGKPLGNVNFCSSLRALKRSPRTPPTTFHG